MRLAIFSDFDGTLCRKDVGYHMFKTFSQGKTDDLVPLWKSGELSTRDCLRREAEMVDIDEERLRGFLDQFRLNEGVKELLDLCRSHDVDFTILSDGFGFYIEHVLANHGLNDLDIITNRGYFEDGELKIDFPHDNVSCQRCGSCKGERIREYLEKVGEETKVVFIGDGYSDVCALAESDLIFAKKDLEQYCRQNNINHVAYDDFNDVIQYLQAQGHLLPA